MSEQVDIDIDPISLLVTCSARLKWESVEAELNKSGYTLGYLNDKQTRLSIQQILYKNPVNILESQYGTALRSCVGLTLMGRDGKRYKSKTVPRTAAGPDFRTLLLNLGTRHGDLEDVTLRLHRVPERVDWHFSYWPTVGKGQSFLEELAAEHVCMSYAAASELKAQARELRQDKLPLISIRFAGLSGLVKAYLDKAAALSKAQGGKMIRSSKRKVVPLLEKMMRESL